jgi:GntR family transcriptional regulator
MRGFREVAADVRRRIEEGHYPPGHALTIDHLREQYGKARQTVRSALSELVRTGHVELITGHPARVRDRRIIRVPLSRYEAASVPDATRGPWESACAAQGLDGQMKLADFRIMPVDDEAGLADRMGLEAGSLVVYRRRHGLIGGTVVMLQEVWYPYDLVRGTGLDRNGKVEGGALAALLRAGVLPRWADEVVRGRAPTAEEAAELRTGAAVPLLWIERLSRDDQGKPLEFVRTLAPTDRVELVYDRLPIPSPGGSQ